MWKHSSCKVTILPLSLSLSFVILWYIWMPKKSTFNSWMTLFFKCPSRPGLAAWLIDLVWFCNLSLFASQFRSSLDNLSAVLSHGLDLTSWFEPYMGSDRGLGTHPLRLVGFRRSPCSRRQCRSCSSRSERSCRESELHRRWRTRAEIGCKKRGMQMNEVHRPKVRWHK